MVLFFPFPLLGIFTSSGPDTYERGEHKYGGRDAYYTLFLGVVW